MKTRGTIIYNEQSLDNDMNRHLIKKYYDADITGLYSI